MMYCYVFAYMYKGQCNYIRSFKQILDIFLDLRNKYFFKNFLHFSLSIMYTFYMIYYINNITGNLILFTFIICILSQCYNYV